jgi:gluconolactonase
LGRAFEASEGPVWWDEWNCLIFSDHRAGRRLKWEPGLEFTVLSEDTNRGNGQTRDVRGRLVVCESSGRRVTAIDPKEQVSVIADHFQGHPLNAPNDVVARSDGSIYFTDPAVNDQMHGLVGISAVYRARLDHPEDLAVVANDFLIPNGLALTPDETGLYVVDTERKHIRLTSLNRDGTLDRASDRVFFAFPPSDLKGLNDGMKVDVEGNVYCTGPGGVWVIDCNGNHLGTISTSADFNTNCCWGGAAWNTLYITAHETLSRIQLNLPGVSLPCGRRL